MAFLTFLASYIVIGMITHMLSVSYDKALHATMDELNLHESHPAILIFTIGLWPIIWGGNVYKLVRGVFR